MASITSWTRFEPVPRSTDMTGGLRAELADPLWLLGRQWQFGELAAEDAGSPVESMLTVEVAPLTRLHPGQVAGAAAARSVDLVDPTAPLESMVERRPVQGTVLDARLAVEAGQHFMRLLGTHSAPAQRARYLDEYALVDRGDPDEHDLVTRRWWSSVAGRVPDGRRLLDDLVRHRGAAPALTSLPPVPAVPANQRARVLKAANDLLRWWESFVDEPTAAADSWDPRRLEYSFATQATLSDGHVVLRADDYEGGRLDWFEFEADTRIDLGPPNADPSTTARTLVRRTMPSPAFYAGMPADRFWEFEDISVRFGSSSVGRTDLAHMLLNEFALAYGNDWFVVPLTLPTGSVCAVRDLRVIDSFGVSTTVRRSVGGGWSMFDLSLRAGAAGRAAGLFFLPSTVEVAQEGDPIEEVAWFRDEMANVVWAVERSTESPAGGSVDRYEHAQQRAASAASQEVVGDVGDASLAYRLNSTVPENWFPLVPVRPPGAPAGVVHLELRPIRRVAADGTSDVALPRSRVLTATDPLVIEEEEIGRDGVNAQLRWELTRDHDGRYHLWLAHRVTTGRGEGSSGLGFDLARPV
ncbi:MAG: hypothetical protein JJE52_00015 [Acidimicrobiia bacterium]|nr:hypothetical protein [Acidimicrobiia bacterium]